MKVSVIIPAYNAEKYLENCLNSILGQTYADFEAVVVDDGSTDESAIICDKFAAQDGRFRVIHKKNEGLICARKTGIIEAKGEYIAFVDADDWIDVDFLETGLRQMENEAADIVITGCTREYGTYSETAQNKIQPGIYGVLELAREVCPRMLHYEGFYEFGILPYIWNKFYKKDLLSPCYEDIDTSIYDGEDVAVVYPYLLHAQKAIITNDTKYHYRIHGESMTANKKDDYYENTARLYLHLAAKFREHTQSADMMPQLDSYMRMMIWQGKPDGFIESTKFVFPFKKVPQGATIVLYGAGYVGKIYYHQICLSEYCVIAAWVDKAYQQEQLKQMGVTGMEALHTKTYDYVILAVRDRNMAAEITEQLFSYGIGKEKIIFYD